MSASTSSHEMGIIIQYDYCTGCHACEMACKQEHDFGLDELGVKVMEYGPKPQRNGRWDYFFIPVFTDSCDFCAKRTAQGKLPACVHHCTAKVMEYGPIADLAQDLANIRKCVLFAPGAQTEEL